MKILLDSLKSLLCEKITEICENKLHYKRELKLQGLLGITLDEEGVILVSLDATVLSVPDSHQLSIASNSCKKTPAVMQVHSLNATNQSENDLEINSLQFQNHADNQCIFHSPKSNMVIRSNYPSLVSMDNAPIELFMSNVESLSSAEELSHINLSQAKQSSIGLNCECDAIETFTLIKLSDYLPQDVPSLTKVVESSCEYDCKKKPRENRNAFKNSYDCNYIELLSQDSNFNEEQSLEKNEFDESILIGDEETDAVGKINSYASQEKTILSSKVQNDLHTIIPPAVNTSEISNSVDAVSI